MPICYPTSPPDDARDHGAERSVWEAVRAALPEDALLFSGLRLQLDQHEREIDLVAVVPGLGLVVIETKGGHVRLIDGVWIQGAGSGHPIDPVYQATRAKHDLVNYLRPFAAGMQGVRTVHMVAFPHATIPSNVESPGLPRALVLDSVNVAGGPQALSDLLTRALTRHGLGTAGPDAKLVDLLADVLAPTWPSQVEALSVAEEHEQRLERMTQAQESVLSFARHVRRIHVVGGAGSGKTWLALAQARRLGKAGNRVALLCYSRGLGRYMTTVTDSWPARERPAWVGLFHDLPVAWGAEPGHDDVPQDWEVRLPGDLARLAAQRSASDLFDAIVVDEAQDFSDLWWPALVTCLRDPATGWLSVFSDDAQRVFPRDGHAPIDLVPFSLDENLRSTREIAQVFGSYSPAILKPRGMHGAPVRLVEAATVDGIGSSDRDARTIASQDVLDAADSAVEALIDEGWEPGHIALLATGSRHGEQINQVELLGYDGYWDSHFREEDVFYGHVLGFKGLERRVVVLAVNGIRDTERAQRMLYTGMSRARTLLVVVGPRAYLERVGGEGVRKRLREAEQWTLTPDES